MTAAPPSPTAGRADRPILPTAMAVIECAVGAPSLALRKDGRLRPGRSGPTQPGRDRPIASSSVPPTRSPETAKAASPTGPMAGGGPSDASTATARPDVPGVGPLAIEHVTPSARASRSGGSGLAALGERPAMRTPAEVPKVYRSRVEPDRPTRARLAGASAASELAVERALDWLARHQDRDGRWNAAVARYDDGTPVPGDRDFTAHCPGDEVCSGVCAYWEADTALTGLALLTYLGAGYTHLQGRYTETVDRGLTFLIRQQKADGDLRGASVVVGMYCHAMATLALCEGYALTGDVRLREPAARRGRLPGPVKGPRPASLALQAGREHRRHQYPRLGGDEPEVGEGGRHSRSPRRPRSVAGSSPGSTGSPPARTAGWPVISRAESVTATMTAEAWVCRQFLGVGGPGPTSTEAAEFLLRNESDRGKTNFYYWYYATLALYQHGGDPGRDGMPRPGIGSSTFSTTRATAPGAGIRMTACTAPRAAGSTARRWPR